MKKPKILIIAGPTAVGKTSFSLRCAKELNGEIISSDSVQIYKELNIGSAKATKEEQSQAVHHLIDFVNPDEEFSVSEFASMCKQKINEVSQKGKLPIIVGGTGLFIKSLLYPMSFGKANKDENVRKKWENFLEENGVDALFDELLKVDKESAMTIEKNNTRRVIRALEIFEVSGEKKSSQTDLEQESDYDYKLLFLNKNREELYSNINKRVEIMFSEGLEKEVYELVKKYNLTRQNQSMQAIGYKEFFDYFENKKSLEEVKEDIKKATRHYAKRQITFFKYLKNVEIVEASDIQKNLEEIKIWQKA